MDEIAEQGFAAHWKYKEGGEIEFTEDEGELNEWLHTIKEILDDPQPDAMDFLDAIKLNLFASERSRALLTENETKCICNIAFTAAVRPENTGNTGLKYELGTFGK